MNISDRQLRESFPFADNDEEITEEWWLREFGSLQVEATRGMIAYDPPPVNAAFLSWDDGARGGNSFDIDAAVKTRGDVRKLMQFFRKKKS